MSDYPLRVKIVASLAIVLAYACLPLFGVVYGAGALADWWCWRSMADYQQRKSKSNRESYH